MASSHSNLHSERAKNEQIITEFFAKSLHIILESRSAYASSSNFSWEQAFSSPSSSSSSSTVRPRDKWFNLALRECPAALENIDFWRQSNYDPMVVDVIVVQRPVDMDPRNCSEKRGIVRNLSQRKQVLTCCSSDLEDLGCSSRREKIVERWILHYESQKVKDTSLGSKRSSCSNSHTLYKKSILLLRSLYSTVRLLPAYKLFHYFNSSFQTGAFTLAHRVSSFVKLLTCSEEAEMQRFAFTPVATSSGRLCLSVMYRSSVVDMNTESSTSMSPQFIPGYVGSPLANPLKRFPSLPVTGAVTRSSPSASPFSRRHSWNYDIYRASPPISYTPLPTHINSCATVSKHSSCCPPSITMTPHPPDASSSDSKSLFFYECCPSPAFSPSSSASLPVYVHGSHLPQSLLCWGSSPVSIPASRTANASPSLNRHVSPPPLLLKCSEPGYSEEKRNNTTVEKLFTLERDEIGNFSDWKIRYNITPHVSISRSSSRLYSYEEFDDTEFTCPFDIDDDDITDPGCRAELLFDKKGPLSEALQSGGSLPKKSQDAAVGTLVHILKKALPLHQDLSKSVTPSEVTSGPSSGQPVALKTASDALDELQGYKDMKNLLLGKIGASNTTSHPGSARGSDNI